jgi:tetratricopeptide (TPR) repeat protein
LNLGDYENALLYFQRGLELYKEMNMGACVAEAYRGLSTTYGHLGRPLEAIKFGQEAIRLDEEHYGAENVPDSTISTNLCNLGGQYIAISEFEKAAEVLEKALAVLDGRGVSIQLAAVLDTLGTAYRSLENSEKALSCLEKALSLQHQLYGIDRAHLDTAQTLTNLGDVYNQLGRFEKAIDYYTESLNMKYALYGPNATHQSIAITLGNIGNVYYELGQYEKAIKYIKASLQKFSDAGSCSRQVAFGLYSLGRSYEGLADFPAAYQCYEKSLPIMVQVLGETHNLVKLVQAILLDIRLVFG